MAENNKKYNFLLFATYQHGFTLVSINNNKLNRK